MAMIGTYFINEKMIIDGLSKDDSIALQISTLQNFMEKHKIMKAKLNPEQLYDFYTNPHALLYDLRKKKVQLDYLIIYSDKIMEDFILYYPARWIIMKSYFKEIIMIIKNEQTPAKKIG
jgi:hypothetical protein